MKVKYKTILMIAFVGILVCGIEISAKEKRVGRSEEHTSELQSR